MNTKNIKAYYAGSTVLVTGGTGYLGKALLEKLLRTCSDIKCIYVLLRSKKGVSCADRMEWLKNHQTFDRVRLENPEALNKLLLLDGDITLDNLGLSSSDEESLKSSLNFVFHSAATVGFIVPIKMALNANVLATKRLLDLCRQSKQLKKFVYISTAYFNPGNDFNEEKVYKSKQQLDLDWYVKCADVLPSDVATAVMHRIHGPFPNTYTMTKFMAEQLVEEYRTRFGISAMIVRPSVIGPTNEEPYPGYIDVINGMSGFVLHVVRGTLSSLSFNPNAIVDIVPMDMVCSNIFVAAWFDTLKPSKEIRVVNCTSGDLNGINHLDMFNLVVKHARQNPSEHTMLYPNMYMPDNRIVHSVLEAVHTFLPAYMFDIGSRLLGKKPVEVATQTIIQKVQVFASFGNQKTYKYSNEAFKEMLQAAAECDDFSEFNFDVCLIDWDDYMKKWVIGLQKYYLTSDQVSHPSHKRALKRLYAGWCAYYGVLDAMTGYAI